MASSLNSSDPPAGRVEVSGLWFDSLSEVGVLEAVRGAWAADLGGSIIPVNVDVALAASRDAALARLIDRGSLVVADGMPIVWAARLEGTPIPERVAGSSLVFSLSAAAEADRKTVYLLGGANGLPEMAAAVLVERFPALRIAGTQSPAFGFDQTDEGVQPVVAEVVSKEPDLIFVGLGFPRQELLIEQLRGELPHAWLLACGGGISMAAGVVGRASPLVQRLGLEWLHRLALEPRRLARRYLRDDLPFALALLTRSAVRGLQRVASRLRSRTS